MYSSAKVTKQRLINIINKRHFGTKIFLELASCGSPYDTHKLQVKTTSKVLLAKNKYNFRFWRLHVEPSRLGKLSKTQNFVKTVRHGHLCQTCVQSVEHFPGKSIRCFSFSTSYSVSAMPVKCARVVVRDTIEIRIAKIKVRPWNVTLLLCNNNSLVRFSLSHSLQVNKKFFVVIFTETLNIIK